jgi:putative oxidoreductase
LANRYFRNFPFMKLYMNTLVRSGQYLFAIPWIVIGVQHFMYADFLETLVPEYMPVRRGWVYLTGIAMMAAGVSFLIDVKPRLAALGIGIMLTFFILQLHAPLVSSDPHNSMHWTRALQDITIASIALMLTSRKELVNSARFIYTGAIIIFGVQHFLNLNFVTAKIPDYLPVTIFWNYLVGLILIIGGIGLLTQKYFSVSAKLIGIALLLFVFLQVPILITDFKNPIKWIIAMLELCIASGALILLRSEREFVKQSA